MGGGVPYLFGMDKFTINDDLKQPRNAWSSLTSLQIENYHRGDLKYKPSYCELEFCIDPKAMLFEMCGQGSWYSTGSYSIVPEGRTLTPNADPGHSSYL